MKSLIIFGALTLISSSALAGERTTVLNDIPRYSVTHKEADSLLKLLKDDSRKDIMKFRPSVKEISKQHGGVAEQEENYATSVRSCWADENQFDEIHRTLLVSWMESWKNNSPVQFEKHLTKNAKIAKFATVFESNPRMLGDIKYYENWNEASRGTIKEYLSSFSKIEDVELVTFKYAARRDYRDAALNMIKADLHIQFDLRGITKDGSRRNDRGPIKVTVIKDGKTWKISEVSDWGLETVMTDKSAFIEMTAQTGVSALPEYQRVEAIRRGGYAVAIGDINNDGIQDMYLGAYGPGKLLLGTKDNKWVESKVSGLGNETLVKTAAFADFNNDGLADLLLTRFVPTKEDSSKFFKDDIVIYKNLGMGKFEKMKQIIIERSPADNAMPAAVADFNNDGLLDFYVGFPGTKDFTTFGKIPNRENLRVQGLYLNKGSFKFTEGDLGDYSKDVYNKVTLHHRIYPHSSVGLDFDQDGDMDIVVIDDRGNISPAYQNDGKGNFTQAEQHIGVKITGFGMGLAAADIDNNGVLDMVFTNVNFTSKVRTDNSCKSNWNAEVFSERDHGLKFYYGMQKGKFADATMKNGLFYAGEGLAGAEFLDYNNDGFQDLYVANGLWSGTDKYQDLTHIWTRSHLANVEQTFTERKLETQSSVMKIMLGFTGDIYSQKKGTSRPGMAGYQRNRLFRNLGDGNFIEVGYMENVDSLADGYVISKVDMDGDGALDLVLRNGDPGSKEVNFPAVQVYKNQTTANSLRLKLIAQTSNRDAIGSSVAIVVDGKKQFQQLINNNGTAQSERIIHFGLGTHKKADQVVVTWPNGKKTTLKNLEAGSHIITEGKELTKAR